ncbi:MAG: tetratricopeptide repeat protein [Anaerolineales bacterium]
MSEYIRIVTESDFEYEVIAYSKQVPVIVDFWAEWCRPCKTLTPVLEKYTIEAQGKFRLAKVNVDDNPNLALRYDVRSIPNVKAFRDGQVVAEFLGLQPEPRVSEFLRNLAPSQIDLLLEKGQSQLETMNWNEAAKSFRQFLAKSPDQPAGLLGLLKALLMQGNFSDAKQIINNFPTSQEYARMEALLPLFAALQREKPNLTLSNNDLENTYQNALRLVMRGNIAAAMDGMIDILRQDKHYHDDETRQVLLSLFEVLGDNHPLTQQYRRELAMVLF